MKLKRALVSVSDKTGLVDFLRPLTEKGLQIISTGGTLKHLQENHFKVQDISEVTGFPEVLDGRVKTLHPRVHMGLLAVRQKKEHEHQMQEHQVEYFDLVIGQLYPFEKTAQNPSATFEELIENIDIGGPSFLRSSAKNFENVLVISDIDDYSWLQDKILNDDISYAERKYLALKVFNLTSYYDSLIVEKLKTPEMNFKYKMQPLKKKETLRYGENAHQNAVWYENPISNYGWHKAQIIQGKELSYNNLLDLEAAYKLVSLFSEPTVVAVKHNNPCGVASGHDLFEAMKKTIQSDPKSIFGGILGLNQSVDLKTAELISSLFIECVVAPSFSKEALDLFRSKKNLRVLLLPLLQESSEQFKSLQGGCLVQSDDQINSEKNWKFIGQKPSDEIFRSILFGEKVCAFLKSNAIALVYRGQTLGLGMGQVNRVDSVLLALHRMKDFEKTEKINRSEVVAISDAFFPFADSLELFKENQIQWIVQPGGSVKDAEVIQYAQNHHINMILTGQRHFRH